MRIASDLALAHSLADVADAITVSGFRQKVHPREKIDGSLVTDVDLAVERALLEMLATERPDDAVLAEESGELGAARRRWILDPLDGTDSYVNGGRGWGTHITLEVNDALTLAVLTRPREGSRYWAMRGGGAYKGSLTAPLSRARRLSVSETASLTDARASGLVPPGSVAAAAIADHLSWVEDEISPIVALLEGRVDAVLDEGGDPWDQAPAALLTKEAGGLFRDPCGGSRLDFAWGLFTNRHLHDQLVAILADNIPA